MVNKMFSIRFKLMNFVNSAQDAICNQVNKSREKSFKIVLFINFKIFLDISIERRVSEAFKSAAWYRRHNQTA